jgi:hypothetical protein
VIINTLQQQTLDITQATARSTYDAAEAMRQYASAAERAKVAATGISPPVPTSTTQPNIAIPQFGQPNLLPNGAVNAFNSAAIEQAVKDLQASIERRQPKLEQINNISGVGDDGVRKLIKSQSAALSTAASQI